MKTKFKYFMIMAIIITTMVVTFVTAYAGPTTRG
jgi:hypothetical protein